MCFFIVSYIISVFFLKPFTCIDMLAIHWARNYTIQAKWFCLVLLNEWRRIYHLWIIYLFQVASFLYFWFMKKRMHSHVPFTFPLSNCKSVCRLSLMQKNNLLSHSEPLLTTVKIWVSDSAGEMQDKIFLFLLLKSYLIIILIILTR